jgi:endonuclease/exonuclease/phosphatase (EEP) superfamily protein YafD
VDVAVSPLVLAQSLSPAAAVLALLAMGAVAAPRRRTGRIALAGSCVAVLAVQVAVSASWFTASEPHRGQDLTVMAVNLYRGHADIAAISRMVRAEGVDVLAVSEVTDAASVRLRRSVLDDLLSHAVSSESGPSASTVLLSRLPVLALPTGGPSSVGAAVRSQQARLPDAAGVIVCAVHVPPPTHGAHRWRIAQEQLSTWAEHMKAPMVVAGDFNASVDHPGMRELLAAGLRDAHEVAGAGRPVTWPNGRTLPPFVHLDHVLVRGVGVESADDVGVPGSDHDAVIAHLVVPAGR